MEVSWYQFDWTWNYWLELDNLSWAKQVFPKSVSNITNQRGDPGFTVLLPIKNEQIRAKAGAINNLLPHPIKVEKEQKGINRGECIFELPDL